MLRCSRKTMIASKRYDDLYWFRPESYVQSQRWSSACSSLECSEVLTIGVARMVEEVGELELEDGLPEEKLQESRGCEEWENLWEWCLGCPCIEFGARACTKKKVLPIEGSRAWERGLANLACKLRLLAAHVQAWLLLWSCGHVVAWCGVVLLCQPWWHCRHDCGSTAILRSVDSAVAFAVVS